MNIKNYLLVSALSITAVGCSAPRLSRYADKPDLSSKAHYDVSQSTIRDNGRGFTVDVAKLRKSPKRIALVSFYVEDPGMTKKSGSRSSGQSFKTSNTSQEGVVLYANYFYKTCKGTLDQSFKTGNMELLSPSEFLTDADKKSYYKSFEVRHSELNKLGGKLTSMFKRGGNAGTTLESKGAAEGFTLCNLNSNKFIANAKKKAVKGSGGVGLFDDKMIQSLGYDLCKELDVDAVIVVNNTMLCDAKRRSSKHYLSAVSMYMFGPNPLPLAEGKKDNMFYSKGLFYTGYRMAFKKGLIMDPKIKDEAKKTTNEQQNEKAYNNMIASMAGKMCSDMQGK